MDKKFIRNTSIFILVILALTFCGLRSVWSSDEIHSPRYTIRLDKPTIAKGYTVAAFEDKIKLSLVPGILSEDTGVEIIELNEPLPLPWQLDRISPVYQFEFKKP